MGRRTTTASTMIMTAQMVTAPAVAITRTASRSGSPRERATRPKRRSPAPRTAATGSTAFSCQFKRTRDTNAPEGNTCFYYPRTGAEVTSWEDDTKAVDSGWEPHGGRFAPGRGALQISDYSGLDVDSAKWFLVFWREASSSTFVAWGVRSIWRIRPVRTLPGPT